MRKSFTVTLKADSEGHAWSFVRVPFDPHQCWPEQDRMRVKGTLQSALGGEEFPFLSTLMGSRDKSYVLLVTKKVQRGAGVGLGDKVVITLEQDNDGASAAPPPELAKLLKQDRSVKKWFDKLPYGMRKYIVQRILECKSADARERRAEKYMETILLTMEGEESLPPLLQIVFREYPGAVAGWKTMTPLQRRNQLFAIFTSQSVDARRRRAERTAEMAMEANEKKTGSASEDRRSRTLKRAVDHSSDWE